MAANVNFNHATKHIEVTKAPVLEGSAWVIDLDFKVDVYSDGKEDWGVDNDLQKFEYPVSGVGGEPLPGAKKLGSTFFIEPPWKIKPYEGDHTLRINGNLYSTDGESPYVGTNGIYSVFVINSVSNLTDSTIQQLPEIEYSTFNGAVWIDVINGGQGGGDGIQYPNGNRQYPTDIISNAFLISDNIGIKTLCVLNTATFTAGHDLSGYTVIGTNPLRTSLTIEAGTVVVNSEFVELGLNGVLDGGTIARRCLIGNLTYLNGFLIDCVLDNGTIYIDGNTDAKFKGCSGNTGTTTTIDMGGSGQGLSIEPYFGSLKITNFAGSTEHVHISMKGGKIEIDATCTSGTIILDGYADFVDNSGVGLTIDNNLISTSGSVTPADIAAIVDAVWSEDVSIYTTEGTAGKLQHDIGHIEKSIFIDTELVQNGDGTAGSPFNNIDDAKTHAENSGIKSIITYSELTLTSAFKNFVVRGLAAPVVDTNGQDISGSEFYHCTMRGLYTGVKSIVAQECALDDGFQLTGYFENCVITGTMNIVTAAVVKNCSSGVAGLGTPTFNMNTGLATSLSVRDWSGGLLVQNCDHASDVATIEMSQGRLFVDNTNTLGLISVRGVSFFDDTSAGATIETSGLLDPSKSQMTQEEQDRLFETLTLKKFIGLK